MLSASGVGRVIEKIFYIQRDYILMEMVLKKRGHYKPKGVNTGVSLIKDAYK